MILKASYGGIAKDGASSDFNPYFGTDVGICSIIKPQLNFNKSLDHLPFWRKLFGEENINIKPGWCTTAEGETREKMGTTKDWPSLVN